MAVYYVASKLSIVVCRVRCISERRKFTLNAKHRRDIELGIETTPDGKQVRLLVVHTLEAHKKCCLTTFSDNTSTEPSTSRPHFYLTPTPTSIKQIRLTFDLLVRFELKFNKFLSVFCFYFFSSAICNNECVQARIINVCVSCPLFLYTTHDTHTHTHIS